MCANINHHISSFALYTLIFLFPNSMASPSSSNDSKKRKRSMETSTPGGNEGMFFLILKHVCYLKHLLPWYINALTT